MNEPFRIPLLALGALVLVFTPVTAGDHSAPGASAAPGGRPTSPQAVAFSPDGAWLAASDPTGSAVWLVEQGGGGEARRIELAGEPRGVAWTESGSLLVAEYGAGSVAEIEAGAGRVLRRFGVGRYPKGVAVVPGGERVLVTDSAIAEVSVIDLATGAEQARLPVSREPGAIAVTPDGKTAVVANELPAGAATTARRGAVLSLLDLDILGRRRDVRLPAGSTGVHGVAVGAGGRWAYAVHIVARTNVPTTQLERGWVNTNALSVIDLERGEVYATLLLDHPFEGAADPWDVVATSDGRVLWITLSGVHEAARIDLEPLHRFLDGGLPEGHPLANSGAYSPGTESVWLRIKNDPNERAELVNDLAALHAADLIERRKLGGKGPRGAAVSPDGATLAIALHFSGEVLLCDAKDGTPRARLALGGSRNPDQAELGREYFHDATLCFQHWLSCATCHPNEARVDGMNWDLLNDGIGNPKNLKSLLLADRTPPMMWRGVREDMPHAVEKGFFMLLRVPQEGEVEAVEAYLRSLRPRPSPYLESGGLSEAARRGEELFLSARTACAVCHPGPLFTDLQRHDVGTRGELDRVDEFDTPSLVELYRTAPYLHDGRAATLREVLLDDNRGDRHGFTSELTEEQLADLVAYLLSL